jgi:glycosyltransferase involved in cell wall biosynthesis
VLRILHVFRAPLGGLFRHVCDLAAEQVRMGHAVGIVCDATRAADAAEQQLQRLTPLCALGITRLPMSRVLSLRDIAAAKAIRGSIAQLVPDIVHGHGAKGGAYARLLPRSKTRVVLYTPHGGALHYHWRSPSGAVFLGLERVLRRRTDGIVFESEFGALAYHAKIGAPRCPERVIPNGLSAEDFAPLPALAPDYDAVFVGELRQLKGVATLIDAVAELTKERGLRVAIAGTGPDGVQFRARAAAAGLSGCVDFIGHAPAREVFARGRIIVVPSLAESFPYIVLEALASGRPLIATAVGGVPEMFGPFAEDLVPAGDAGVLAAALRSTLDNPEPALRRAQRLKERVFTHFSAARMAQDITHFYAELQARRAGVPAGFSDFLNPRETTAI